MQNDQIWYFGRLSSRYRLIYGGIGHDRSGTLFARGFKFGHFRVNTRVFAGNGGMNRGFSCVSLGTTYIALLI